MKSNFFLKVYRDLTFESTLQDYSGGTLGTTELYGRPVDRPTVFATFVTRVTSSPEKRTVNAALVHEQTFTLSFIPVIGS